MGQPEYLLKFLIFYNIIFYIFFFDPVFEYVFFSSRWELHVWLTDTLAAFTS